MQFDEDVDVVKKRMEDYIAELKDDLDNEKENVRNLKEEKKQLLIDLEQQK